VLMRIAGAAEPELIPWRLARRRRLDLQLLVDGRPFPGSTMRGSATLSLRNKRHVGAEAVRKHIGNMLLRCQSIYRRTIFVVRA
jgi:hypothetical protein